MLDKETITDWFKELQNSICRSLETTDGKGKFREDQWQRKEGGGGRTRVISDGNIIEKGGVNFSAVHGALPENIANALKLNDSEFYATGVSIVLHPLNPMVPIIHMNVRYFETSSEDGDHTWWFGGGIDLTPHYIDTKDAAYFHQQLKEVCDRHHPDHYSKFKRWADDYFYIKHRDETRGVGGIFFDRMSKEYGTKEEVFSFVQEVGSAFAPIYTYYMKKNALLTFDHAHKDWQMLRRSRYVEFNLVWDKGTKFGLETNGRIESILMSLPPQANWVYDHQPEEGTPEAETQAFLKKDIDWLQYA